MNKFFFALGSILCAIAVGTGALGAHALKGEFEPYFLEVYKTAVLYHFLHALGIIILSILPAGFQTKSLRIATWLLFIGILFFSGSLYLLSTHTLWSDATFSWLGPITPIGGLFFIVGWITAAIGIYQKKI